MFDAVLNRSRAPRRPMGTGAAAAVAVHLWILVVCLAHTARPAMEKEPPVEVVFQASLPRAGDGKPAGGGKPAAAPKAPAKPARAAHRPKPPPRPVVTDTPPAATSEPESTPDPGPVGPADADAEPGNGGDGDGDGDGTGSGAGGGCGAGGTGTGQASTPPPTQLTLSIGDPALDQSTCVMLGKPPYPREALAQKIEGVVLARCVVEPDGSLSGCAVLKAPYSFEGPVKAFLAGARARPFTSSGRPVRVPCNFSFRYRIAD